MGGERTPHVVLCIDACDCTSQNLDSVKVQMAAMSRPAIESSWTLSDSTNGRLLLEHGLRVRRGRTVLEPSALISGRPADDTPSGVSMQSHTVVDASQYSRVSVVCHICRVTSDR